MEDKVEWFACQCHTPEHVIKVISEECGKGIDYAFPFPPLLTVQPFLHCHSTVWRRIVTAIKYICGVQTNQFCDILLQDEDVNRFRALLNHHSLQAMEYSRKLESSKRALEDANLELQHDPITDYNIRACQDK